MSNVQYLAQEEVYERFSAHGSSVKKRKKDDDQYYDNSSKKSENSAE